MSEQKGQWAMGNEPEELSPELKRAMELLDQRAQASASRLDVNRVSERVISRLQTEPLPGGMPVRRYATRIAAALALIVGGLLLMRDRAPEVASLPVPMDSVSVADSQAVLMAVQQAATDTTMTVTNGVTVEDLNEQELRALLQALESEESL